MRPLRFILSLAICVITFLLLIYSASSTDISEDDYQDSAGIGAYFNWRTPSSLFPPSAIISLTDDNSTFFLARPAAFGPLLPSKSLSGQIWIGSGFGDDHLGRGGAAGSEGELGCSDIPDWSDDNYWNFAAGGRRPTSDTRGAVGDADPVGKHRRSIQVETDAGEAEDLEDPTGDDGTDDHLHHPLPASGGMKINGTPLGNAKKPAHADIQSLQEGAEIAGKVVLLSRGGCGFLEKVKWTQRRGGIALIVGDDIRGGPLVTMYGRGDTSNVTIPALFTSHTTAHLLTTLIPSGGEMGDLSEEEIAKLGLAVGQNADRAKPGEGRDAVPDKPNFTTTSPASKATSIAKSQKKAHNLDSTSSEHQSLGGVASRKRFGWFGNVFGGRGANRWEDSRRPPSSGNIGWVLQEDFDETEQPAHGKIGKQATTTTTGTRGAVKTPNRDSADGFVIGVQDWRDADLVAEQKERMEASTASLSSSAVVPVQSKMVKPGGLKGGSITPGSGEYVKSAHEAVDLVNHGKPVPQELSSEKHAKTADSSRGWWFTRIFHSKDNEPKSKHPAKHADPKAAVPIPHPVLSQSVNGQNAAAAGRLPSHDGLWVTLTPTSMSSSPFFDTLLVLVVSPLVTLTVVYALLLLRSRIRRRRWRAPKSVVERLPIRTYQTMSSASSVSSTTSVSTNVSATTPLLPSAARPISTRSRPRSRTASEVPAPSSRSSLPSMAPPSLEQIEEKRAAGLAEWRRRYGGKQRECVVCLEEYVDGVSRVMSLPCGHEFHAECITPWLTTRRRTCPICKGDVVRSLGRSSNSNSSPFSSHNSYERNASSSSQHPSSHSHLPVPEYQDEDPSEGEEEDEETARNEDAWSVSREAEALEDLERGIDRTR